MGIVVDRGMVRQCGPARGVGVGGDGKKLFCNLFCDPDFLSGILFLSDFLR
jgi:hypothetical protein